MVSLTSASYLLAIEQDDIAGWQNPNSDVLQISQAEYSSWSSIVCPQQVGSLTNLSFVSGQDETLDLAAFFPNGCPDVFPEWTDLGSPTSLQLSETPLSSREEEVAEESTPQIEKIRKRRRPKLNHPEPGSSGDARMPHTRVEKKYRDKLNAGMERLRAHVPTLPQFDGRLFTTPRPSKATVLEAAVDYIKRLEAENEELKKAQNNVRNGTFGQRKTDRSKPARAT